MRSSLVIAACAVLVSAALGIDAEETEEQQFKRLWDQGIDQLSNGQLEDAVATFRAQVDLAPEHPGPCYNLACAYARSAGQHGEALSWLERAVDLDWNAADQTSEDSDLASLRNDPRFDQLLQRMRANQSRWLERSERAHRIVDPAEAAQFQTLAELLEHFDTEEESLAADAFRYSADRNTKRRWLLLDQKVAALKRYASEEPDPACREHAAFAEIEALAAYKEMDLSSYWDADGPVVVAASDRFLAEFPGSAHDADVLFKRAMATWLSRPRPAEIPEDSVLRLSDEYADDLDSLLAELASRYPTSAVAAMAMVKRLELPELQYDGAITPLQGEIFAELIHQFGDSTEIMQNAWRTVRRTMFHAHGFSGFHGKDLEGLTWNDTSLRGKVVLIDFWATWCGPCMSELPTLKDAYATFKHRGFEIIGVSLDRGDHTAFESKLEKLEISWPQIFDGTGWESELARQFNVYSIPCTVILDRDGTVAGVDFRGEKLIERIAELVE